MNRRVGTAYEQRRVFSFAIPIPDDDAMAKFLENTIPAELAIITSKAVGKLFKNYVSFNSIPLLGEVSFTIFARDENSGEK